MPVLILVLILCLCIHLLSIAAAGSLMGVTVRELSLGFGPTVFKTGRFKLGLIPTGGYVRFKDSREEDIPPQEMGTALDGQSTWRQLLITLSGCAVLLALSAATLGISAAQASWAGARDFLQGGLSPAGQAQRLLLDAAAFVASASSVSLFGVVAAKLAAINLLPFPALNGGAAIAVVGRGLGLARRWPAAASRWLLLAYVAIALAWIAALALFALKT